ncbi:YrrS family protein [Peribacillus sp. SCS-37]|uniref:YrrS family protein n=1 Tax=Paraperibacillus esterisolvens TaxID=3115296 RepID=UPI003905E34B
MERDLNNNSRLDKTKQKKANRIYNFLIIIVSILILSVAGFIFMGGKEDKSAGKSTSGQKAETAAKQNKDNDETARPEKDDSAADLTAKEPEEEKKDPDKVTEVPDDSPNVKRSYVNESWKPVGTSQQGEHTATYEEGSADWIEMEKALAYGAKIDPGNLTVWWIENNGSPNSAAGTVSAKDSDQTYRVFIEWVDGQGWKPVKVQELKVNDKK